MRIIITYEASWRNSFLDPATSNNEPLPKNGRKFFGSMTSLRKPENYISRQVTTDTVMGVLNRLVGDQRKLYQARASENYYFREIETRVKFEDRPEFTNTEMVYIRNISRSTDQNSFAGVIRSNDPILTSDFSSELWGVLALTVEELCQFILDDRFVIAKDIPLDPNSMADLAESLSKIKALPSTDEINNVVNLLNRDFTELSTEKLPKPYVEKTGDILPVRLYAAALYLQFDRLSSKFDMSLGVTKSGKIAGFSKRGFNGRRDFMKNFVTGGEKKIWGNPYAVKDFKSLKPVLTKASGKLEVKLDIEREQAERLLRDIESAGVSSFYLGKKGLAYVSDIRI